MIDYSLISVLENIYRSSPLNFNSCFINNWYPLTNSSDWIIPFPSIWISSILRAVPCPQPTISSLPLATSMLPGLSFNKLCVGEPL